MSEGRNPSKGPIRIPRMTWYRKKEKEEYKFQQSGKITHKANVYVKRFPSQSFWLRLLKCSNSSQWTDISESSVSLFFRFVPCGKLKMSPSLSVAAPSLSTLSSYDIWPIYMKQTKKQTPSGFVAGASTLQPLTSLTRSCSWKMDGQYMRIYIYS